MNVSRIVHTKRRLPKIVFKDNPKVEIGCGDSKLPGYIGVDILDKGQDIVWDIEQGLPFPDNTIAQIRCSHTFEHLDDLIGVMNECWRVLRSDGELYAIVPGRNNERVEMPTHVRYFSQKTFEFFTTNEVDNYDACLWKITESVENERGDIHVKMTPIKA